MSNVLSTAGRHDVPVQAAAPETFRRRQDGAVEMSELWRILWYRRLMILGMAALLTACALVYGLLTPSLYTASAQILIDPRDRNVVSNDVNPSSLSPDGGIAQVESQASVIQSTGVLTRAIRAIDLTKDPEFSGQGLLSRLFGGTATEKVATTPTLTQSEARTLTILRNKMSVRRADKVLVVDVVVTTQQAEKSAMIANAIAAAYLADQAESRSDGAREASASLTARLAEQRKRVEAAENAVERYRAENNLVASSGRLITDQQLGEISNQVSAAEARTAALRAQVEQIAQQRRRGTLAGSSSEAMQSAVIAKLREQEGALIQREGDLQSQFGPRHPAIAAARSQLSNIRQLIAVEIQRVEQSVRADYDRALGNEKLLKTKLDALTKQTQGSDLASVRLRDLQRDLEAARSVYANFLLRAQETREQASLDTTNARVISQAQAPQQRSWPPLGLLLAGAASLGLGLGAGIALIREYASPGLLSVSQAEAVIGAPVLGVLNAAKRRTRKRDAGADPHAEGVAGLALLRLFDKRERVGMAARSVLLISTDRDVAQRLRTALLLADAAAGRGDRVLMIDADSDQKADDESKGLLDVLRGECGLTDAIRFGEGNAVALMPKGRARQSQQKVSARDFAGRMMGEASRHFDILVIDGGILTRNVQISPLVATAEQIVLVTQLYSTKQTDIVQLVEAARIMGRSVSGAILVDALGRAG